MGVLAALLLWAVRIYLLLSHQEVGDVHVYLHGGTLIWVVLSLAKVWIEIRKQEVPQEPSRPQTVVEIREVPVRDEARVQALERKIVRLEGELAQISAEAESLRSANLSLATSRAMLDEENTKLQTLERKKSDLLANVSHDLRTPLVSVRGYVELIVHETLGTINTQQRDGLQIVLRNLDRLVCMIENLLEYSTLSQGHVKLKMESFSLSQMARDVADLARRQAPEKKLDIQFRYESPDGGDSSSAMHVVGDRVKIHQVLSNLVGNAVKFTQDEGKVRLYLRTATDQEIEAVEESILAVHNASRIEPSPANGSWVMCRVLDTGCGIAPEDLEHVFDRHFKVRTNPNGGSGLGLAITDEIVRHHGGAIEVSSELGKGTSFTLWLPIGTERVVSTSMMKISRQRTGVLVVDDEPDICEFAELVLVGEGHQVSLAHNEEQMWQRIQHSAPQVILLDYTLPGRNGLEVLQKLKSDARTTDIPVLMISGMSGAIRDECLRAGALDFLDKPFALDRLVGAVEGALSPQVEPEVRSSL